MKKIASNPDFFLNDGTVCNDKRNDLLISSTAVLFIYLDLTLDGVVSYSAGICSFEDILAKDHPPPFVDSHQGQNLISSNSEFQIEQEEIIKDCQRLGIKDAASYHQLAVNVSSIAPQLKDLVEMEIKYHQQRVFSGNKLQIQSEYDDHLSCILKSLFEIITKDKTRHFKTAEAKGKHDYKKLQHRYHLIFQLFHVRNRQFSGPFKKEISDLLYSKHEDVDFTYNLLSHMGITESLPSVVNRQRIRSKSRDVKEEIKRRGEKTYIFTYDNFCKTHARYDSVHGNQQSRTVDLLIRSVIFFLYPTACSTYDGPCTCHWSKDVN